MSIFESTDRDGDGFTVEPEPYLDGAAVTVSVRLNDGIKAYAYLSASDVDRLRVALAPYGNGQTPRNIEDATRYPAEFAVPSRAVVKRAQAASLAKAILGRDGEAMDVVSLAEFISGGMA